MIKLTYPAVLLVCALFALTGCGGGSGSGEANASIAGDTVGDIKNGAGDSESTDDVDAVGDLDDDDVWQEAPGEHQYKLMTYNVFMMPFVLKGMGIPLLTDVNIKERARLIGDAEFLKGNDVIIFTEGFSPEADVLKEALEEEYPFQTPVLGQSRNGWSSQDAGNFRPVDFLTGLTGNVLDHFINTDYSTIAAMNGGVFIVSRHEIVEKRQYVFAGGCGFDRGANKGFVYVKINRNGNFFHVIGTHLQSEDSLCNRPASEIRASQIEEVKTFLRGQNIPEEDVVFIGGDFNIDRASEEYKNLVSGDDSIMGSLGVYEPAYSGADTTYDSKVNGLTRAQYPYKKNTETGEEENLPEYIDYIFVSKNHKALPFWHNQSLDIPSPRWKVYDSVQNKTWYFQDYSDHYPVSAFTYADGNTPTHSYKSQNGNYDSVQFKSLATGKFLRASRPGYKVYADGEAGDSSTKFTIANQNYVVSDCVYGDIGEADYVTVESNDHPGNYIGWDAKDYFDLPSAFSQETLAIKLKDEPAWNLRLEVDYKNNRCIGNGDIIYFMDYVYFYQTILSRPTNLYIDIWTDQQNQLYLWSSSPEDGFEVVMDPDPVYADWSSRLRYWPDRE
ncbi:endonuclease/exonuclease/phosphatase family protein [Alcanivoracaceae bacterium MT1]